MNRPNQSYLIQFNCIVLLKIALFTLAMISSLLFHAQWVQLGEPIDGELGDFFGWELDMSTDGNVVAIGATEANGNGPGSGLVRIYEWDNVNWVQRGDDINGEAAHDLSGTGVSLSGDGQRIAIGAERNDGNGQNSGHVRVFEWNGQSWEQLGSDIDGVNSEDRAGWGVSISSDGSTVAVGSRLFDGSGSSSGHVRVFTWTGTTWAQRGNDIVGEAAGDLSGISVSLSVEGNIVAIGAPWNDGNGFRAGHARVYLWTGQYWDQLGSDIDGEMAQDYSGIRLSLSNEGDRIAIGAPRNDGDTGDINDNRGHVRVFEFVDNDWIQMGLDLEGVSANDHYGDWYGVALAGDQPRIVVGAWTANPSYFDVYEWNGSDWVLIFNNEEDMSPNCDGFGVAISSDGKRIAIGDPCRNNFSGIVKVYQDNSLPIPTLSQWGLIILGFLLVIFGITAVRDRTSFSITYN